MSRSIRSTVVALSLLGLGLLHPAACGAQVTMFLHMDGIEGESTDPAHSKWIEVESYGHGVSVPDATVQSPGTPDFQPIRILKRIDKSSPPLIVAAALGTRFSNVTLDVVRKVAGQPMTFFQILMDPAKITSVSSTSDPNGLPQELVTFVFGRIRWTSTFIDPNTGAPGTVSRNWDTAPPVFP